MLAHKQSKCEYLLDIFYKTPCCQCLGVILVIIPFTIILYLWFKVNTTWFEPKDIFVVMFTEFWVIFTCISTIIGIFNVLRTKCKDPNIPLCKILQDNTHFFFNGIILIILLLIVEFIRCVYFINIWVINNGYISYCLILSRKSTTLNEVEIRAQDCTFFELLVIPSCVFIILIICFLIGVPLIETVKLLNNGAKHYDTNQNLLNEKDSV